MICRHSSPTISAVSDPSNPRSSNASVLLTLFPPTLSKGSISGCISRGRSAVRSGLAPWPFKLEHFPSTYYLILKSYLWDRFFRVRQAGEHCGCFPIEASVPQGSVLGPEPSNFTVPLQRNTVVQSMSLDPGPRPTQQWNSGGYLYTTHCSITAMAFTSCLSLKNPRTSDLNHCPPLLILSMFGQRLNCNIAFPTEHRPRSSALPVNPSLYPTPPFLSGH